MSYPFHLFIIRQHPGAWSRRSAAQRHVCGSEPSRRPLHSRRPCCHAVFPKTQDDNNNTSQKCIFTVSCVIIKKIKIFNNNNTFHFLTIQTEKNTVLNG